MHSISFANARSFAENLREPVDLGFGLGLSILLDNNTILPFQLLATGRDRIGWLYSCIPCCIQCPQRLVWLNMLACVEDHRFSAVIHFRRSRFGTLIRLRGPRILNKDTTQQPPVKHSTHLKVFTGILQS
jgi:hypothetical protein